MEANARTGAGQAQLSPFTLQMAALTPAMVVGSWTFDVWCSTFLFLLSTALPAHAEAPNPPDVVLMR